MYLVGVLRQWARRCSRCDATTGLKLCGCISRWAVNLSREHDVADTQENGCSSTESFYWSFCTKQPFFTFTDTAHIKCMCVCGSVEIFIYSLVRLLCTFISRAASKPYLVAPTQIHCWPLCQKGRQLSFNSSVATTIQTFRYSMMEPTALQSIHLSNLFTQMFCSKL